jgi:hypothetical protein
VRVAWADAGRAGSRTTASTIHDHEKQSFDALRISNFSLLTGLVRQNEPTGMER